MAKLILVNKPYKVLSQFTDSEGRKTLRSLINIKDVYPAGRLDYDSEGLLLLTDDGQLQARISSPKFKLKKTYYVQVEGVPNDEALALLRSGVELNDGLTRPAVVEIISEPQVWSRDPPIRVRQSMATTWLSVTISEGKNRQVRRMTASVGYPTLRLIRYSIGDWNVESIPKPGDFKVLQVNMPEPSGRRRSVTRQRGATGRRSRHAK